jgi:hypothetical protein
MFVLSDVKHLLAIIWFYLAKIAQKYGKIWNDKDSKKQSFFVTWIVFCTVYLTLYELIPALSYMCLAHIFIIMWI